MRQIGVPEGFFYSATPQAIRYGNEIDKNDFLLPNDPAIFSSSMSVSLVPKSLSKYFFKKLLKNVKHTEDNGLFYVECAVHPDDIFLMFDNKWIHIRGQDMVIDISQYQDMSMCIINFLPSVDNYWVLGNSIYKDYYVTHNPE